MNFTTEQLAAIEASRTGNIYMSAAAGSGKSSTLAEIARTAIDDNQYARIMLITFTNKSARDIISKVGDSYGNKITGGTFHSISWRLLRDSGYDGTICDSNKSDMIIKQLFDCKKDKDLFDEITSIISKDKSIYPQGTNTFTTRYDGELRKYNMLDFDDIINIGNDFIKEHDLTLPYTHILVDELQDTSQSQFEWLKTVQAKSGARIIGVGDYMQSIYGFRGARPENVNDLVDYFKCTVYNLSYNFRSDISIIEHSNKLTKHADAKFRLHVNANSKAKGVVKVHKCNDVFSEIAYMVSLCRKFRYKDVAILYRNRRHKMNIEFELKKANLRYTVNDSTEITDRSPFRVMVSMIKIASCKYDIYDIQEAAKGMAKLGKTTVDKLLNLKLGNLDFDTELKLASDDDKKLDKALTNVWKLQSEFKKLEGGQLNDMVRILPDFMTKSFNMSDLIFQFMMDISGSYKTTKVGVRELCDDFGLNVQQEVNDEHANIELSTIHGYKGGESDIVIMPFCDWPLYDDSELEGERRLFYVGITRPKNELYITYSGQTKPQFIEEMGL